MRNYDPPRDPLPGLPGGQNSITLSFTRVEELLGEPLPPSAHAYDDWWRGRARWRKVIESRPWESVGWVVDDLDLRLGLVTFRRQEESAGTGGGGNGVGRGGAGEFWG